MTLVLLKKSIRFIIKRVLNYFPNANKQNDGSNVILVFEQGMQQMSKTFVECSKHQQDALILLKLQKLYAIKSSM